MLVRCLMLGLSGILHMGSNDKFDKIIEIFYLFSIIWNKIEQFRFETAIEPWSWGSLIAVSYGYYAISC